MTEQRANNQPTLIWLSAISQEEVTSDARQGLGEVKISESTYRLEISGVSLGDSLAS